MGVMAELWFALVLIVLFAVFVVLPPWREKWREDRERRRRE